MSVHPGTETSANVAGGGGQAPSAGRPAPVADWVSIAELYRDPYPVYERMREEGPVVWVPAVDRYLVIGYDACHTVDNDPETFTADEEGSLMKRAMGHSMLRKDDPEHAEERAMYGSVLKPRTVKNVWTDVFRRNARRYLDEYRAMGPGADFHTGFAAPYAAENLREVLGFRNATQQDVQRWSQDMINATGNYADDPEVWELGRTAFDEVDAAVDELLPVLREDPDHTLLSQLLASGMPMTSLRANLKMTIGGGLNEPRDVLGTLVWVLLSNPDQLQAVRADPSLWVPAFDEAVRWVAPIGMYSRQTTREVVLDGIRLPAGARLGVNAGAANRDPAQYEHPERYDLHRGRVAHMGFGSGAHFCAGAWIARAQVANVAMPMLFDEFRDLALSPEREPVAGGWVFRGMLDLPLTWTE